MPKVLLHVARGHLNRRGYESRKVDTTVGQVHSIEASGEGGLPPVVLLHGLSATGLSYARLLDHLRPHVRRVVAPDAPGHGLSDVPIGGMTGDAVREGLFEALDHLIDEPAILFGNSMGGFAAIRYASERPEKVRSLVLASPGGAQMTAEALGALLDRFRMQSLSDAMDFVDRLLHHRPPLRPAFAWMLRRFVDTKHVRDLIATANAEDLLTPEEVAGLAVPILFFWGRSERILPPHSLDFFRRYLPDHAVIERPHNFGHSPQIEHAKHLSKRILSFINEVHA